MSLTEVEKKGKAGVVEGVGSSGNATIPEFREKKRRLILSDSEESDDYLVSLGSKKEGIELLNCDNAKAEGKIVRDEEDVCSKKGDMNSTGSEEKRVGDAIEKKRAVDVFVEENVVKRMKMDPLKNRRGHREERAEEKIDRDCLRYEEKKSSKFQNDHLSDSKPEVIPRRKSGSLKDKENKKLQQEKPNKPSQLGIPRSETRAESVLRKSKGYVNFDDEMQKSSKCLGAMIGEAWTDSDSRRFSSRRADKMDSRRTDAMKEAKGATSGALLPKRRQKVEEVKSQSTREEKGSKSSLHMGKREKINATKSIPNIRTDKPQTTVRKNSFAEKGKSDLTKKGLKVSFSEKKPGHKHFFHSSKSSSFPSSKYIRNEIPKQGSERLQTTKQKIREQIKGILLNAGWRIDLRPRRGRNYDDQVYVSPAGTGYWSITKAYAVFKEESGSSLPAEVISILKRNVVKKRRSKEEMSEAQKNKHKKLKSDTKNGKDRTRLRENSEGKGGCALLVRGVSRDSDDSDDDGYVPYVWKRTILSWLIDLGVVVVNGAVKYMNRRRTSALLKGHITRDGIHCNCCSKILSAAKFEIHAGSKLHRPYENIYVEKTGLSLLECQIKAWKGLNPSERQSFYTINIEGDDPNDDTCGICGDGGDLICCDSCPSTFHLNCLGIKVLPCGDWNCMHCSCKFCLKVSDSDSEGMGEKFSGLFPCSLCENKYHLNCVPESDRVSSYSNKAGRQFCSQSCKRIFNRLQKLIGVKNGLEAGFSWSLICRFDNDLSKDQCGLAQKAECNSKISVAFALMDECFLPITDQRSGMNLIHNVVYNCGSNFKRLSYSGFYTFVLERGDEIVCAASVRIHGARLAEMPFIGTRIMYRRQGMCRLLLRGIENALSSLNVERLIIPAITELTETWTKSFGFELLDPEHKQELKHLNILVFPGTGLMQKTLLVADSDENCYMGNGVGNNRREDKALKHEERKETICTSVISSIKNERNGEAKASYNVDGTRPATEVSVVCSDTCPISKSSSPHFASAITYSSVLVQPDDTRTSEPFVEDKSPAGSLSQLESVTHNENIILDAHEVGNDNTILEPLEHLTHESIVCANDSDGAVKSFYSMDLCNLNDHNLGCDDLKGNLCVHEKDSEDSRSCDCDPPDRFLDFSAAEEQVKLTPSVLEGCSLGEFLHNGIHETEAEISVSESGKVNMCADQGPIYNAGEEGDSVSRGFALNSAILDRPGSIGFQGNSEMSVEGPEKITVQSQEECGISVSCDSIVVESFIGEKSGLCDDMVLLYSSVIKKVKHSEPDSPGNDEKVFGELKTDEASIVPLKASLASISVDPPFSDGIDCAILNHGINPSKQTACLIPGNCSVD